MYEKRFQLKRRPFPATPDDSLYYPATGHESALQALLGAVDNDEGLILLTGEPGTGKTLLAHCVSDRLGPETTTAFLTNSRLADATALLQAILFDLQLPYEDASDQVLRLRLTDYLLKNCLAGKRFVLIVDEAHHLKPQLLEELRLLGNLEAGGRKAFQAILLAQPDILQTLKQPCLAAVHQRLSLRCALEPLGLEEAIDYLLHHLRLAGGKAEKVMDESALEVIARGTHGVPRLLNQAAHQTLHLADAAELDQADAEAALEALAVLGMTQEGGADEEVAASGEGEMAAVESGREVDEEAQAPPAEEGAAFEVGGPRNGETPPFRLARDTRRSA
jgi:general secretion pathway protein A